MSFPYTITYFREICYPNLHFSIFFLCQFQFDTPHPKPPLPIQSQIRSPSHVEAGTNPLRINTRFYATLSNGPYLHFLFFRTLSTFLSYAYTVTSYYSFFCDSLLSLMYSTTFLCFVIGSLFICTLKWIVGYVFGGLYLLCFILSI